MKKSIKHGNYVDDLAFYKTLRNRRRRFTDVDELWWLVHVFWVTGKVNEYMYQRFEDIFGE